MSTISSGSTSSAEVVERVLSLSRTSSCTVIVDEAHDVDVRFANNTTTTNGDRHYRHVTVIAFGERRDGISVGVASKTGVDDLETLVHAAEAECADAPLADDAAPFVPSDEGDRYSDEVGETDYSALSSVIDHLPSAFDRAKSRSEVFAGFATHSVVTTFLGTSTGLRRRHVQRDGSVEYVVRAGDGTRSAWVAAGAADFGTVDMDRLVNRLFTRIDWAKRRIDLEPGRYEVLLPPDAVADLMVPLEQAASGRDALDGQSVFSGTSGTRLGEQLSKTPFTLASDPNYPGLECEPFLVAHGSNIDASVFDNGLATGRVEWIRDGRLSALRFHRAAAARTANVFTPPAENLILDVPNPGGTLEDLISRTRRGLLVTCLWYIREVDLNTLLLTGLTHDGVYLVENGEITGAVNNFRFNESPVDLLGRVSEVGVTERAVSREWNEWMNLTAMPTLRVEDFNMSSVSPAN